MRKRKTLTVTTTVSRHMPQFSRLATIPLEAVAPWKLTQTTVVEGTINGVDFGRRSMKRWDDRNCWWVDLPEALCKKAKIDDGDEVQLKLSLASEDLPVELEQLITTNKSAKTRWDKMTTAQQRMLREEVFAAKSPEARTRRAFKNLV